LPEAVDSVLASSYQNIEIIVINDGSTQDVDFLKTFRAPKTKVIQQANQGVSQARNNGIKSSEGKYILVLDADDKIAPTYIKKAVGILESREEISIVYSEAEFFGSTSGKWTIGEYSFPEILWSNSIFCSALFKKSDWEKVGGYKKEMVFGFEDWEFWLSLIEGGAQVFRIPEVLFFYRQHPDTRSKSLKNNENEVLMIKQMVKFHPNLYADNLEKILLPMHKIFETYASNQSFILKLKRKITNFLRKV